MPVVECEQCREEIQVDTRDLAYWVVCPLCNTEFRPVTNDQPVRRSRRNYDRRGLYEDDEYEHDDPIQYAQRECRSAATGLQAAGWISLVLAFLMILVAVFSWNDGSPADVAIFGGFAVYSLVAGILHVVAGGQMKRAKNWGLALTACVIGLFSSIGWLGMVFGILGIVKLSNARVKRGFRLNDPNYDPDTDPGETY